MKRSKKSVKDFIHLPLAGKPHRKCDVLRENKSFIAKTLFAKKKKIQ